MMCVMRIVDVKLVMTSAILLLHACRVMFGLWGFQLLCMLLLPKLALQHGLVEALPGWTVRSGLLWPLTVLCDMASVPQVWLPLVCFSSHLLYCKLISDYSMPNSSLPPTLT